MCEHFRRYLSFVWVSHRGILTASAVGADSPYNRTAPLVIDRALLPSLLIFVLMVNRVSGYYPVLSIATGRLFDRYAVYFMAKASGL